MWAWTDNDGHPEDALTKDQMLDNISIYWFTGSGASSAPSTGRASPTSAAGRSVPTGCSIFPKEIIRCSRRWAEKRYTNIGYWNELDAGGHFAAWEQPEVFVNEFERLPDPLGRGAQRRVRRSSQGGRT